MARILLINPPWYRFMGLGFRQIPMSLSYLAGTLETFDHQVGVLNADFEGSEVKSAQKIYKSHDAYLRRIHDRGDAVWIELKGDIEKFRPDIVAVHMKTGSYLTALNTARLAKEINPSVITVMGGPHPTMIPEDIARKDVVDFVVLGEGEETMAELAGLDGNAGASRVRSIAFSDGKEVVITEPRPLIKDVDSLPFPSRRSILFREKYPKDAFGIIFTARGCPFECTYCASKKIWTRRVRFRSPGNVIEEMSQVYTDYNTKYFQIRDDTFTLNKSRAIEICEGLIKSGIRITWHCDTRADCVDDELVRVMKAAGCAHVSIGIESGSERILERIKKGETPAQMEKAFSLFRKYGISTNAFIMIGFPGETRDDVKKTMALAKRCRPDNLVLSILTPYPGTEIYEQAVEEGRIKPSGDWEVYYHQSPEMGLWDMPPEEENRLKEESMKEVALYNASLLRLAHRFWAIFRKNPGTAFQKAISFLK